MFGSVRPVLSLAAFVYSTVLGQQVSRTAEPLCNEGRTVCVPAALSHSTLANPFTIDVRVTARDWYALKWRLTDSTGNNLGESQMGEYTRDVAGSEPQTVHVHNFIFKPAASAEGTLTFTPVKLSRDYLDLPGLQIPVRLNTQTSDVTIFQPASWNDLLVAAESWFASGNTGVPSDLPIRTTSQRRTIMKVQTDRIVEATIETLLVESPAQSPWHVAYCRRIGSAVHVRMVGDTWAGSSLFFKGVEYLVTKSLLNLPGITRVVFE